MDEVLNGYFSEICPMWKGMTLSVAVRAQLLDVHTAFQHLEVFDTETYGHMMTLDGKIQCTERDEFAYHEMLVHPALFSHAHPCRVLIAGGGDGGAVREVLKHDSVEHVTLCEIDDAVIAASKEFFPSISVELDNPKLTIVRDDAFAFVQNTMDQYDVIIVDSSDPIGPAEGLFTVDFYAALKRILRPGGIIAAQSDHFMIHTPTYIELRTAMCSQFAFYNYVFANVPSYPGGGVGIALCSDSSIVHQPCRAVPPTMTLHYYTPELHLASAVLPRFMNEVRV